MSKFLHLGMSLDEVVRASTATPASVISRLEEFGTLKHGMCADVSIFKLRKGKFPLVDVNGTRRMGRKMLTPMHVIREGEIVLFDGEPIEGPSRRQ
jgi:dihydroorotase